jgi:lipopolysaccharide export system ATP-binding protein
VIRLGRLPRLRNAYLRRGILVWWAIRFTAAFTGMVFLNTRATLGLLVMVAVGVVLYTRRRWEDILLGNLGIPLREAVAWALPLPMAAEALIPGPVLAAGGADPAPSPYGGGSVSAGGFAPILVSGSGMGGGMRGVAELERPQPGTTVLEVDGLGKSFWRTTVLKSASFRAVAGEVTALMGRNGSGKTTMLRISVGRVGAGYGRIFWRGDFVERPRLFRMAREGLFFSAQESALTSHFTVGDHLDAVVRTFGGGDRVEEVVARMRLSEFLGRRPQQISGGERQRASLAMALLRRPVCLLMDEPFSGVAPRDRPLIAAGLRGLRDDGCAVVVSGHDVEELFDVADQVMWVVAGTTHWLGSPAEAATHPQFRREYLGPRGKAG